MGLLRRAVFVALAAVVALSCIDAAPTSSRQEGESVGITPVLVHEWSPTTAPFATPSWEDITSKVRGVSINGGRSHELDQFFAGVSYYTIDNRDRAFDPNYSAGANFGNLKPRRRIRTTIISGPVVQSANGSLYAIYVDTDGSLITKTTTQKAASPTIVLDDSGGQGWSVGVENDGTLRTDTTASAEANVPVLQDLDGVKWVVSVETDGALTTTTTTNAATGVAEYLSTRFIDGYPQDYNQPKDATIDLTATDGFKILARMPLPSVWEQEIRDDLANITAWWRLGENQGTVAQDSSGNGNHGTYVGGATFNHRDGLVSGDSDGAIEFAEAQRVTTDPTLISAYPFTIEGVFIAPADGSSDEQRILVIWSSPGTSADLSAVAVLIEADTHTHPGYVFATVSDASGGTTSFRSVRSNSRVDDGQAHHFVFIGNSSSDLEFWIDGVEQTTVLTGGSGTPAVSSYTDGALGNTIDDIVELAGTLDDVIVYAGYALPSARIAAHYSASFAPWDEDTPAARITRILDAVGWPATDRDIDTGRAQLGPFEATDSALEALQNVARAEGGRSMLYIDGAGKLVFRGRSDFWTTATYHTSNATFGDDVAGGELPYYHQGFRIEHDDSEIINRARIAPNTGWFQQVDDATSQTNSGIITHEERILEKRSAYALNAAEYIVARKKDDVDRLEAVTIRPERAPTDLYPVILDADFGYRYTFKRRPQGIGDPISIDVHLEHVTHDITPGSWTTRWQLSPVEADAFRWDSGNGARFGWGAGVWSY